MLRSGHIIAERYQLAELLGEGGYGCVFAAEDLTTGRRVAVKTLKTHRLTGSKAQVERERFERELLAISKLDHPSIVRALDSGHTGDGARFAVLTYVDGPPLSRVIKREGRIEQDEAFHIMSQVADALAYAHRQGIIHRDLKPANIMLVDGPGEHRDAVVVDFGIASLYGADRSLGRLTTQSSIPGTPAYMAPECMRAEPATAASDIYAWGLIFIEMLSGRRPIKGPSSPEMIAQQLAPHPIHLPRNVRIAPFAHVIEAAVQKPLAQRLDDADVLLGLLADPSRDLPALAPETIASKAPDFGDDFVPHNALDTDRDAAPDPPNRAPTVAGTASAPATSVQSSGVTATTAATPRLSPWALALVAALCLALGFAATSFVVSRDDDHDPSPASDAESRAAKQPTSATGDGPPDPDETPAEALAESSPDATPSESSTEQPAPDRVVPGAPPPPLRVTDVAAATWSTCALLSDGTTRCWGDNLHRQVADDGPRLVPWATQRDEVPPFVALTGGPGSVHTGSVHCGLTEDGPPWCWGSNHNGRFGDGNTPADSTEPVPIPTLAGALEIQHAHDQSCARFDASVRCWYHAENTDRLPTPGPPLTIEGNVVERTRGFALVRAGGCLLDDAGTPWCWDAAPDPDLQRIDGLSGATSIAANDAGWFCVISDDPRKQAACWRRGMSPRAVPDTEHIVTLSGGVKDFCGTSTDPTSLICWSITHPTGTIPPQPKRVTTSPATLTRSRHGQAVCAIEAGGTGVRCSGGNARGQLGRGHIGRDDTSWQSVAELIATEAPGPDRPPASDGIGFVSPPIEASTKPPGCKHTLVVTRDDEVVRFDEHTGFSGEFRDAGPPVLRIPVLERPRFDPFDYAGCPVFDELVVDIQIPLPAAVGSYRPDRAHVRLLDNDTCLSAWTPEGEGQWVDGELVLYRSDSSSVCGTLTATTDTGHTIRGSFAAWRLTDSGLPADPREPL